MNPSAPLPISRESYGTLLLLLAAPSLLPGVGAVAAPLSGAACLALGFQLAAGRRIPWVPDRLQGWMSSSALGPRLSLWIQEHFRPLLGLPTPRFPLVLAGLTVAWTGLLLVLPLMFVPFSNMIPALALGLVGAGLAARRSLISWLGMALSGGYTALLIILGEALILAAQETLARFV